MVLTTLFAGNNDGFVAWVGERTKPLAYAHDLAMRDADLETVIQFMEAKARRTRPFVIPEARVTEHQMNPPGLFPGENWNRP